MATDVNVIRRFDCFRHLTDEQVEAIAKISNSVCYPKGHVLFEEGQKGDYLYLLVDGDVDVFYTNPKTGLEKVDTISSDEIVGCSAMVPPYVYAATQRTLSDVEVLEIGIEQLREIIDNDPRIGLSIQEHIIKILNDRILELRHRAIS